MNHKELVNGLIYLGFTSGWAASGNQIVLWENNEPQPSMQEIQEAAKKYIEPELSIEQKLASVGLSITDLKTALGL